MEQEPAMDAYSAAVIRVAESVLPSVAAVSVRTSRGAGAGSASVISADGHLLTSAHVVAGAERVEVAFADGTELPADVVGRDPLSDLAVLRADGSTPPPVPWGDASALRVGQLVVALGRARPCSPPSRCTVFPPRHRPMCSVSARLRCLGANGGGARGRSEARGATSRGRPCTSRGSPRARPRR